MYKRLEDVFLRGLMNLKKRMKRHKRHKRKKLQHKEILQKCSIKDKDDFMTVYENASNESVCGKWLLYTIIFIMTFLTMTWMVLFIPWLVRHAQTISFKDIYAFVNKICILLLQRYMYISCHNSVHNHQPCSNTVFLNRLSGGSSAVSICCIPVDEPEPGIIIHRPAPPPPDLLDN